VAWYDNVPVVSWVLLRARCRSCGKPISARYPVVELLSGALWLLMWWLFGTTATMVFAIAFVYLLMILSFIDLDTMRLPNSLVGLLALLGVAGVVAAQVLHVPAVPLFSGSGALAEPWAFAAAGLLIGGGIPLAISAVYSMLRGKTGLGMGDVKLLAAMGIYLGPYVVMALMFGSILGALGALLMRQEDLARRKVPFGPYLSLGALAVIVAGPQLWAWYTAFL